MGFGAKWRGWMEKLVFKSHMSILVNGSSTEDFEVGKGLRQGDPLSPFLFVLVTEGLTGLVRKSIEIGEFDYFSINRNCPIDILQFADDTLLVGKGNWKHIWAIKAVLKAFELVSGLGIKYHKSKLIGINLNGSFLEAASNVLSCKVKDSNFFFLGIPVGYNPRKNETWEPLLSKMRNRLADADKGGEGVHASSKRFLMGGGGEDKRCIHWISWREVTKPFEKGGLGIKNIEDFNLSLLSKWRWKIIQGADSLWYKVLKERYGDLVLKVMGGAVDPIERRKASFWWKDLMKLGSNSFFDPFLSSCRFLLRNGYNIPFWDVMWLNGLILKEVFSNLYEASSLKMVLVAAMGGWVDNRWTWGNCGISENRLLEHEVAVE
ncbi:uncharacterized protein LOC131620179 [Vicia villosa]|uniref:uncharacterized protein LOC131620179 n=1 Tax=Vicia villosa TaxID=3911 RepID=UPI00273C5B60|nr:uncharacterized protein LOC131620179 [Vicia villosa]